MAPVFFTSYARLDNNKYSKLSDAVDELRERVRSRVGAASIGDIGFFDLEDIQNGADWVTRLGEGVAKCRMFVCFCSNTYFNREVCGKEFEAFRQRLGAAVGRYVFPIIWDKCDLPKALQQFQANSKLLPREYFEDGLLSLRRVRREAEYETAVEALAQAIADAWGDPALPQGPHPLNFDQLASAFDNPGSNAVRIAVLADKGVLWETIPGRTARAAIEEATARSQVRWRQLDGGLGLPAMLESSAPEHEPVVLILPTPDALWQQRLAAIDAALARERRARCAVLVGSKQAPAPGDGMVQALFPASFAALEAKLVFHEANAASLVEIMRLAIDRLQTSALAAGNVAAVSDATLAQAALDGGIPVTRPVLAGPGGRT